MMSQGYLLLEYDPYDGATTLQVRISKVIGARMLGVQWTRKARSIGEA